MSRTEANATDARELALYAVNDGGLYERHALPIIANLARKMAAGTYDAALALKAWQYLADDAAKAYSKDFGPCSFDKATRELAAREIADHYAEQLAEAGADATNRKRWTLSAIKAANEAAGGYFFSRKTMQFFGDTMSHFGVVCEDGKVFVERIKASRSPAGTRWLFNPETGAL